MPPPEEADEKLADEFKKKGNEFFGTGDYESAARLYSLSLKHWSRCVGDGCGVRSTSTLAVTHTCI
jgi:hypothetical protein